MATVSSYDPALKQVYRPELVEIATYKKRPGIGLVPKYEQFGGRDMPVPVVHSNVQMRSHTFSNAQGSSVDSAMVDFLLTRVENHSLAHVSSQVAAATLNKKHSFIKAIKFEVDSAMNTLSDSLESEIFRDGTGVLGQAGTLSTTSLTLADINDITNFELNMELVATAGSTKTAALRVGNATVTGINRTTGVLTSDSDWDAQITSFAANDWVGVQGDLYANSSYKAIRGFEAWFPATAPSASESFFGVDRSVDSRLWGTYHDGSSQLVEEALIDAQSKSGREGGMPNKILLNNAQYRKLIKELGAKKEYSETGAVGAKGMVAGVGYRGVKIHGDYSEMDVIPANKCQSAVAYGLEPEKCTLPSLGALVRFDDTDGQKILRRASASGVEARLVSWAQFGSKCPVANFHCALSAA